VYIKGEISDEKFFCVGSSNSEDRQVAIVSLYRGS